MSYNPISMNTNPYLLNPGALGQAYYQQAYMLHAQPPPPPPPPPPAPPSPIPASVSPLAALKATKRLVSVELKEAGFQGAEPAAMERLEREVVFLIERLYGRAHEYANLSNRTGAIPTDLMLACDELDLSLSKLRSVKNKGKKRLSRLENIRIQSAHTHAGSIVVDAPQLIPPPSRSPSPEMLSSDDEDGQTNGTPYTLRNLPNNFPALPPKHTYHQTPISPSKKAALPSLEKKLKTAGLVQESLRNLMLATEDRSGHTDSELLGHTVNWESNVHPRKRWKFGA